LSAGVAIRHYRYFGVVLLFAQSFIFGERCGAVVEIVHQPDNGPCVTSKRVGLSVDWSRLHLFREDTDDNRMRNALASVLVFRGQDGRADAKDAEHSGQV
jgi:hypothetical protein